ncbi:MAG: HAD family phosphatase [Ferruginibacter sp.]
MSTPIRNIIFDLGGVLLNIDYNKTSSAFKELGFENFDNMYSQFSADQLFEKLETGTVTEKDFLDILSGVAEKSVRNEEIIKAWNAMLLDFRKESLDFLESLAAKYNLYLLSNTNAIHMNAFHDDFVKQTGKNLLDDYFIKAWYSNKIGLRKPNKNIYEYVLKDGKLKAEETLFIDDSINNIEAAMEMGIQTFHLKQGQKIEDIVLLHG